MAARRLPALADHEEPKWARVALSADRLSGPLLLFRAEGHGRGRSRSTRSIPNFCAPMKARHSLREQEVLAGVQDDAAVAVDAVFDSVSVATTFKAELAKAGVIFCPISEAVQSHPELVKKYLGSVVPVTDNYFATLEFGGVFRRLLRLYSAGRALPDGAVDLFPHQRAEHRPVRAHADHRRQGSYVSISKAAPRRSATKTSCTRPWSNSSRSTMPKSNIPRCRTGIPATAEGKGGIYNS